MKLDKSKAKLCRSERVNALVCRSVSTWSVSVPASKPNPVTQVCIEIAGYG